MKAAEVAECEWRCSELSLMQDDSDTVYDGYSITYTYSENDAYPLLFHYDWVESLKQNGEYREGLSSQICRICVNDNGIISIACDDLYTRSGDSKTAELMEWSQVLESIGAHIGEYYKDKGITHNITFNTIRLEYYMDRGSDGSAVLHPIWAFMAVDEAVLNYDMYEYPTEILLVDAVSGDVINP